MRTTITLDADVAEQLKKATARAGKSFRKVVNDALRRGLNQLKEPPAKKPYRTKPHNMGNHPGISLDNIQELLSRIEGEDAR